MYDLRHRNFGSSPILSIDQTTTSSASSTSGILQYETGFPSVRRNLKRKLFKAVSIIVLFLTISTSLLSRSVEEVLALLSEERHKIDRTPDKNIYLEQNQYLHQSNAAQLETEDGDAHLLSTSVIAPYKREDLAVLSAPIMTTGKTGISLPLEKTHNNDQEKTSSGAKHPLVLHYSWTQPALDISWNSCHLDVIHYYSDDDVDKFVQQYRPSFYSVFRTNLTKIEKVRRRKISLCHCPNNITTTHRRLMNLFSLFFIALFNFVS